MALPQNVLPSGIRKDPSGIGKDPDVPFPERSGMATLCPSQMDWEGSQWDWK